MIYELEYKVHSGSNIKFSPNLLSEDCECFLGKEKISIPRKGTQKLFAGISQINVTGNSLKWSLMKNIDKK